jgi:hypothetical protein
MQSSFFMLEDCYTYPESTELFIEDQAFSPSYEMAPHPPPHPSPDRQEDRERDTT